MRAVGGLSPSARARPGLALGGPGACIPASVALCLDPLPLGLGEGPAQTCLRARPRLFYLNRSNYSMWHMIVLA